jgi:hypothetical protein
MEEQITSVLYHDIFMDKNQITIRISMSFKAFNCAVRSISELHRKITNGKQVLGGLTNRKFWKSTFEGGLYTFNIIKEEVKITYHVKAKVPISEAIINQLKVRIKRIVWANIQIECAQKPDFGNLNNKQTRFIGVYHNRKNLMLKCGANE